jgi:hypothetical protein
MPTLITEYSAGINLSQENGFHFVAAVDMSLFKKIALKTNMT